MSSSLDDLEGCLGRSRGSGIDLIKEFVGESGVRSLFFSKASANCKLKEVKQPSPF